MFQLGCKNPMWQQMQYSKLKQPKCHRRKMQVFLLRLRKAKFSRRFSKAAENGTDSASYGIEEE